LVLVSPSGLEQAPPRFFDEKPIDSELRRVVKIVLFAAADVHRVAHSDLDYR